MKKLKQDICEFCREDCKGEIKLTPLLKKREGDIDWWYQTGQYIMKEEYADKYIGIRDKKILVFATFEQVRNEIKNKGLSLLTKYEGRGIISEPSFEIERV